MWLVCYVSGWCLHGTTVDSVYQ